MSEHKLTFEQREAAMSVEEDVIDKPEKYAHEYVWMVDRIAELEAVVSTLPQTEDGVPVVPGMRAWLTPDVAVNVYHDKYGLILDFGDNGKPRPLGMYDTTEKLYSTPEAARKSVDEEPT